MPYLSSITTTLWSRVTEYMLIFIVKKETFWTIMRLVASSYEWTSCWKNYKWRKLNCHVRHQHLSNLSLSSHLFPIWRRWVASFFFLCVFNTSRLTGIWLCAITSECFRMYLVQFSSNDGTSLPGLVNTYFFLSCLCEFKLIQFCMDLVQGLLTWLLFKILMYHAYRIWAKSFWQLFWWHDQLALKHSSF